MTIASYVSDSTPALLVRQLLLGLQLFFVLQNGLSPFVLKCVYTAVGVIVLWPCIDTGGLSLYSVFMLGPSV